ncbi:MAG: hypothetical protein WHS86_15610 [Desulfosoma sp.]
MFRQIQKLIGLGKALSISVVSQALSSATNFAITMFLVRCMDKAGFGLYSLGFSMILVLAGVITAPIGSPFVVNVPDKPLESRRIYAVQHVYLVMLLGIAAILLGAVIYYVSIPFQLGRSNVTPLALPLAFAVAGYSVRDILIRVAYTERREGVVFVTTVTVTVAVILLYTIVFLSCRTISPMIALLAYAGGQLAGCTAGWFLLKLPLSGLCFRDLKDVFRDLWPLGRWNFSTSIVYSIRMQGHNFVVGPLLGAVALGEINAARVLITPALLAIPPLTQVLLPRLAAKRVQGIALLSRAALFATGGLMGIVVVYITFLHIFSPGLLLRVLGPRYEGVGPYVSAWSAVALLLAMRNGLTLALEALRYFGGIFVANALAAVVALAGAFFLVKLFGAGGAIWALVTAEGVLSFFLMVLLALRMPDICSSVFFRNSHKGP